ncbi:acyltransferase family protein [Deinococcus sonorensis]|uniref:Acyltransferase family protein n=2 Tax=Deinococcus sonorensis TaxID=309891 RepID=A0AAU7U4I9_9DEIO
MTGPRPSAVTPRPFRRVLRPSWTPYLFIAPFFLVLLGFGLFPLAFSLYLSFCDWNPVRGLGAIRWDGLWAYRNVFTDPLYWPAFWRSVTTALAATVPQHLLALPLAFGIHLAFRRVQGVLGTVLFLPYVTSPVAAGGVLGALFLFAWRPLEALLRVVLAPLGVELPADLGSGLPFEAFSLLWTTLGWNVLLYLMGLGIIPRSLYEAAQVDGASLWWQFRAISLPLLRPMIFIAFTISFLQAVQANTWQPAANAGGLSVPPYIFRTGFFELDFGLAAAQTWVFFGGVLLIVGLAYALLGRNFTSLDVSAVGEQAEGPLHLPAAALVAFKLVLAVALFMATVPLASVLLNLTRTANFQPLALGTDFQNNYDDLLLRVPQFWRTVWNSSYVSSLAALGAVLTSSLAGFAFALLPFRHKERLYAAVLALMLFPSLLNIIPTAMLMQVIGWLDQARAMWVPAAASAFGIFLTRQYMVTALPASVVEAARLDGASTFTIYRRLALPLAAPVLATVGLLTFIGTWNNSMNALAVFKTPETQLVLQALSTVVRPGGDGTAAYRFGLALATLPTLLVFALTAHQVSRGMNLGRSRLTTGTPAVAGDGHRPNGSAIGGADGMRAIACLMVIAHHLAQRFDPSRQPAALRELHAFLITGQVGVSAFFVLSGTLLSLPFWRRYLNGQPRPDLREYARRRALRIAPGYYASLLLSVLVSIAFVANAEHPWLRLLSAATFTSAFHYLTFFPADLNGPLWSIGFEVVCYLLMPLGMLGLFALLPRRSAGAAFGYWILTLGVVMLAHQWTLNHLVPGGAGRGWQYGIVGGAKFWMPNYNPLGLYAHYILGILAAGAIAVGQRRWRAHLTFDALGVAGFAGMLALLWQLRHAPEFTHSVGEQPYFFPWLPGLVALTLATLPFSRWARYAFDNRFFRYTARVSFGLYIWHYLILELIRLLHQPAFTYAGIDSLPDFLALSAAAVWLAYRGAALSYRHIEAPFLRGVSKQERRVERSEPSIAPAPSRLNLPRLLQWSLAGLLLVYAGHHVYFRQPSGRQLASLVQNLARNPEFLPVKSSDGAGLRRYEFTALGTTGMTWHSPNDWTIEVLSPRFALHELAPEVRSLGMRGDRERFEITAGPLMGLTVDQNPLEVHIYSAAQQQ